MDHHNSTPRRLIRQSERRCSTPTDSPFQSSDLLLTRADGFPEAHGTAGGLWQIGSCDEHGLCVIACSVRWISWFGAVMERKMTSVCPFFLRLAVCKIQLERRSPGARANARSGVTRPVSSLAWRRGSPAAFLLRFFSNTRAFCTRIHNVRNSHAPVGLLDRRVIRTYCRWFRLGGRKTCSVIGLAIRGQRSALLIHGAGSEDVTRSGDWPRPDSGEMTRSRDRP